MPIRASARGGLKAMARTSGRRGTIAAAVRSQELAAARRFGLSARSVRRVPSDTDPGPHPRVTLDRCGRALDGSVRWGLEGRTRPSSTAPAVVPATFARRDRAIRDWGRPRVGPAGCRPARGPDPRAASRCRCTGLPGRGPHARPAPREPRHRAHQLGTARDDKGAREDRKRRRSEMTTPGAGGHLLQNLLLFGRVLRGLGLDGSPATMIDLAAALSEIDLGHKSDVYHAMRALVVRRREGARTLRRAFEAFWRKPAESWTSLDLRAIGDGAGSGQSRFTPAPLRSAGGPEPRAPSGPERGDTSPSGRPPTARRDPVATRISER